MLTRPLDAPADEIPDSEAVRLACDGDACAFEHLYRRHGRRVYALCLRLTHSPTDAEDMTQEAFMQLFRKIHTFRGETSFTTWMHRLTVNVVFMRLRKKRNPEISLDATMESDEDGARSPIYVGGPDLRLSGALDRVNLNRAIEQLPNGYRQMFLLHDVHGYEHKEIAGILGCSVGTSKSQLFNARLRLRKLLRETQRSRPRQRRQPFVASENTFQRVQVSAR